MYHLPILWISFSCLLLNLDIFNCYGNEHWNQISLFAKYRYILMISEYSGNIWRLSDITINKGDGWEGFFFSPWEKIYFCSILHSSTFLFLMVLNFAVECFWVLHSIWQDLTAKMNHTLLLWDAAWHKGSIKTSYLCTGILTNKTFSKEHHSVFCRKCFSNKINMEFIFSWITFWHLMPHIQDHNLVF